jgi:hypothetical protein
MMLHSYRWKALHPQYHKAEGGKVDFNDILSIVWLILIFVIMMIVVSLPLYLTARWLDEDKGFLWALGVTVLLLIAFVLCLALIPVAILNLLVAVFACLLVIKVSYDTYWGKTLAMAIVAVVIAVVMFFIIGFILGLGLLLSL